MDQQEYLAILFNDCNFTVAQRKGFLKLRFGKEFPNELDNMERHKAIEELLTFKGNLQPEVPERPAETKHCRGCGAPMIWGELKGRPHPMNPDGTSHFSTCPKAALFRKKRA